MLTDVKSGVGWLVIPIIPTEHQNYTIWVNFMLKLKLGLEKYCTDEVDEPKPKFSSLSKHELWRFQAEPSQAGALQLSSWNRADNRQCVCQRIANFLIV